MVFFTIFCRIMGNLWLNLQNGRFSKSSLLGEKLLKLELWTSDLHATSVSYDTRNKLVRASCGILFTWEDILKNYSFIWFFPKRPILHVQIKNFLMSICISIICCKNLISMYLCRRTYILNFQYWKLSNFHFWHQNLHKLANWEKSCIF